MFEYLERLKKEWSTIRAAPWSFVLVTVILSSGCFYGFQHYYGHRLDDAENRASQWKADVDYWKDQASHTKPQDHLEADKTATPIPPGSHNSSASKQARGSVKIPAGSLITATTNAPDSAAVGINTGTVTVNPPLNPNRDTVAYDFVGVRRKTSLGGWSVDDSGLDVFKDFRNRSAAHDWRGLAAMAENQKQQRPEWLTPYFAAAEAYSQLCEKSKAIENVEYFVQKAEGSSGYSDAFAAAKQELQTFKENRWPPQCAGVAEDAGH